MDPLIALHRAQGLDVVGRLPIEFLSPHEVQNELLEGVRHGHAPVSPPWLRFGRWECGVACSSDFTYAPVTSSRPSGFRLSIYGVDAFVGYRPRLGAVSGVVGIAGGGRRALH